ncbi:MAG: hypothetical protein JKY87_02625 [Mariprofundus sp.]|nr:hypothetical protein [Mariprofundus sp.]
MLEDRLVSITEASKYINRSVKYIQNNLRKKPTHFPLCIKGGSGTVIEFRMSDIQSWIAGLPAQQRATRK